MTEFKNKILYSKYNNLSKIYDMNTNELIEIIPSSMYYYDSKKGQIKKDRVLDEFVSNYSILGMNKNNNNNSNKCITDKANLIKLKSGYIALKIPYIKILKLKMYKM